MAGLTYGTIYAIVGIGFNIIYNTTGIINFAQGEFVMLGGMTAVTLHAFLPLPLAILGAVLITMVIGGLIEIAFIRWLVKPSVLRMIIITIGISILIREAALTIWGEGVRSLPYFTGNEMSALSLGGVRVSPQVLWSIGVCSVIVLFLNLFFKHTMLGREMRACASNREAAALCGIPTKNMVTFSFVLSAGIGALAGLRGFADHLYAVQYRHGLGDQGIYRRHPGRARQQHGCGGCRASFSASSSPSASGSCRRRTRTRSPSRSCSRCCSSGRAACSGTGKP